MPDQNQSPAQVTAQDMIVALEGRFNEVSTQNIRLLAMLSAQNRRVSELETTIADMLSAIETDKQDHQDETDE